MCTQGVERKDNFDTNSEETGRIVYTVAEFYGNPCGLAKHIAMFQAGHKCEEFENWNGLFGELMGEEGTEFINPAYLSSTWKLDPEEAEGPTDFVME